MLLEDLFSDGSAIQIPAGTSILDAELNINAQADILILFVHTGSNKRSMYRPENQASILNRAGFSVLSISLLTEEEREIDKFSDGDLFDGDMLADRLEQCVEWAKNATETENLEIGIYGVGKATNACIQVASFKPEEIKAMALYGLKEDITFPVKTPTMLIECEADQDGVKISKENIPRLKGKSRLEIVHGEISYSTDKATRISCLWFERMLDF